MAEDAKHSASEAPLRRNRTEPVARGAMGLGAEALARAGFRDPTLVLRWAEIAGAEVARIAQPLRLSQGPSGAVLTLMAEPGAALFLQHERRALLERLNGYLGGGAIARLKFMQAPLASRPKPLTRPRRPGAVAPNDPAQSFKGPDAVRQALLGLASRRHRPD
jgi:hypothetical protein